MHAQRASCAPGRHHQWGAHYVRKPSSRVLKIASVLACSVVCVGVHFPVAAAGAEMAAAPQAQSLDYSSDPQTVLESVQGDDCFPDGCSEPAEVPEPGSPSPDAPVQTLGASGPGWSIACEVRQDNAHMSTGAGGAIFKARVRCTGYGAYGVSVVHKGLLHFAPSDSPDDTSNLVYERRASSNKSRSVTINGGWTTYYVPATGNGGTGIGYWERFSLIYFTYAGVRSTNGTALDYNWAEIK